MDKPFGYWLGFIIIYLNLTGAWIILGGYEKHLTLLPTTLAFGFYDTTHCLTKEIRLDCITNCLTDNSRKSSYFSQTNSILFSKAKYLKKVNISFTGYSIKQHDIVEYLACQP